MSEENEETTAEKEMPVANNKSDAYMPDEGGFEVKFEGLDEGELEGVSGHSFHDSAWVEVIDEDKMDIQGEISSLSFDFPESVCGRDDRVKIGNTTSAPYKFICKLYIKAADGKNYIGSGFFIGPRCIITSGHVVHSKAGWAKSFRAVPGLNGGTAPFGSQSCGRAFTVIGWAKYRDANYDHGAIILPNNVLYNRIRGYFGFHEQGGLPTLNNSGYPGDKQPSTKQWYNSGRATKNTGFRFEYMIDTFGGQSGSPTWVKSGSRRSVVGVHGYGGCPNKCIRAQGYVLQRWGEWRQK